MKLIIENFPPITKKSEIDLSKKFIIFVGENNAGKTLQKLKMKSIK